MPTLRQRLAGYLLRDERDRLARATESFTAIYQRWPSIVRESLTQEDKARFGELDSRLIDLMARQMRYNVGTQLYEASESDRLRAVDQSRRAYDNDTLVEQIVDLWTDFGFGVMLDVVPRDEAAHPYWDNFWTSPRNAYLLSDRRLQDLSMHVLRDGDFLLVFFINTLTGETTVREVQTVEVTGGPYGNGVITLPDDRAVPVLYRRQVLAAELDAPFPVQYYRDWRATDAMVDLVMQHEGWDFGDGVLMYDAKPTTRVIALHVAHRARNLRGWPLMTTGLPWTQAYRDFLQDRAAIARAAAMYFEKLKVKGGARAIDSIVAQLQSSLAQNSNTYETNPINAAGATWVENDQVSRERFPMSTGAGDAATDGAALMAQGAQAGRIPPHWLGRGSDVQWATSQEMRIPVMRSFNRYQLFWSSIFGDMAEIVLRAAEDFAPRMVGKTFENYEVDVNTDALIDVDPDTINSLLGAVGTAVGDQALTAADAQKVAPYLVRQALHGIGVRNVDDILPLADAEPEAQIDVTAEPEAEAFAEARPFGAEAYLRGLRGAARGLWAGALDAGGFYDMATNAIEVGLTDAWHAGALEVGVQPEELSSTERMALAAAISTEYGYVTNLADYILAGSKANGGKFADLAARLQTWAMRWGSIRDQAMAMAGKDQKLKWNLGPTDQHCVDCAALDGKVKRASVWHTAGILPRSQKLECNGFNCGCSLTKTDDPMTRGPLPRLAKEI